MPHNAKAMNSLFTYLKNRTMEDITKELNSATQYLRVMKRTGNHKEDCDNVLMHLANIEDLVNKLNIDDVSKPKGTVCKHKGCKHRHVNEFDGYCLKHYNQPAN
tara:strand:- start:51 stop:362 length:312 start_codon:yes stop_codon:yes gene_type:complete